MKHPQKISKYLLQGGESKVRIELLLSLTKISSEPQKQALIDHYVGGLNETEAAVANTVTQSNFNRALSRLNDVAGTVEKIKELDWYHLKSVK